MGTVRRRIREDPFEGTEGTDEFGNEIKWVVRVLVMHSHDDPDVVWHSAPLAYEIAVVVRSQFDKFIHNFMTQALRLITTMIEKNPRREARMNYVHGLGGWV